MCAFMRTGEEVAVTLSNIMTTPTVLSLPHSYRTLSHPTGEEVAVTLSNIARSHVELRDYAKAKARNPSFIIALITLPYLINVS